MVRLFNNNGGSGGAALEVSDGSTNVFNVSEILFTGATVGNGGGGIATVLISATASSITVGTTTVASGTTGRVLYDNAGVLGEMTNTGSGTVNVLQNTPTLTTPNLGVASATSINKVAITAPATGATLTIADGKTLTVNKTMSFTAADDTGVYTLPTGTKTLLATDGSAASLTSFPTLNQNTTGSAATLTTTRTLWGQNFNGSANVTGDITLSTANITMTGSIAATGARATKVWTTDLESTNMPTVGGTAILTSLTAPQFTTIELGNASDTTLARVSAGIISVEGKPVLLSAPRNDTVASSATPTINTDTTEVFTITALAANITSMTTNLSGTPANGQRLLIRILDNGTARTITWGTSYASRGATLPTTTVISKYLYVSLIWNSTASTWDCVGAVQEI